MATLRSNYTQEAANGAYSTSTTTAFTIPVFGGSDTQEFNDVSWVSVGQVVYFSDGTSWGLFTVTAVDHKADTVTLKNTWNEINGTVINVDGRLSPAGKPGGQGIQGVQGVQGVQGNAGISAYEIAVNEGFVGTEAQWLASLVGAQGIQGIQGIQGVAGNDGSNGSDGLSAYEIAVNAGFTGTEQEWLVHIVGTDGKDGAPGQDGNDGLSAYEVAVNAGFVGTEQQWLNSLVGGQGIQGVPGSDGSDGSDGKSAYQVAVDNGFIGTEQAWIDTLRGPQGEKGDPGHDGAVGASGLSAYQVAINNGFVGTEPIWLASLKGDVGEPGNLHVYSSLILPNNARINGVEHFYQTTKPTVRGDSSALGIGDRWWKTDDGTEWFWNGTYWLGQEQVAVIEPTNLNISNGSDRYRVQGGYTSKGGAYDVFLKSIHTHMIFSSAQSPGGTIDSDTNYWDIQYQTVFIANSPRDITGATYSSQGITNGSANGPFIDLTVNAIVNQLTGVGRFGFHYTRTGSPSAIYSFPTTFIYCLVAP